MLGGVAFRKVNWDKSVVKKSEDSSAKKEEKSK